MLNKGMRFESWAGCPGRFIMTLITALVHNGLSPSHFRVSKNKCKIVPVDVMKHVREWRYNSTNSLPWRWIEASLFWRPWKFSGWILSTSVSSYYVSHYCVALPCFSISIDKSFGLVNMSAGVGGQPMEAHGRPHPSIRGASFRGHEVKCLAVGFIQYHPSTNKLISIFWRLPLINASYKESDVVL
jgi:hypothetical protein